MPGSLIDLNLLTNTLPAQIIVDSSLIVPRLRAAQRTLTPIAAAHAQRFFRLLDESSAIGLVPPTAFGEVLHFMVKAHFRDLIASHRAALMAGRPGQRGFDWIDLYKLRPDLIMHLRADLELLPPLLRTNRLAVIQPQDMRPHLRNPSWENELIETILGYHLDTNDAAIPLEAQRAGLTSIATLDADLRRAAIDFDVYTWL